MGRKRRSGGRNDVCSPPRLRENDVPQRQSATPLPFEALVRIVVAARRQATTERFAASTSDRGFTRPAPAADIGQDR
jgi:hypothetical protein